MDSSQQSNSQDLILKIRGYRSVGFKPVELPLNRGVTALVGPNNAGKSNLLRWLNDLLVAIRGYSATSGYIYDTQSHRTLQPENGTSRSYFFHNGGENITLSFSLSDWKSLPDSEVKRLTLLLSHYSTNDIEISPVMNQRDGCVPSWSENANPVVLNENGRSTEIRLTRDVMCKRLAELCNSIYIPAFRNILHGSAGHHMSLATGKYFVELWHRWQSGANPEEHRRIADVEETIANIYSVSSVRIEANYDQDDLLVTIDKDKFPLRFWGAGLAELIYILGNVALRKPAYVFLDEPECHLHPFIQPLLIEALSRFASRGVLFSTHNMSLARIAATNAFAVSKEDGQTVIKDIESLVDDSDFLGQMMLAGSRDYGYKHVLLCEGATDVAVFRQFLKKINKDREVVILPLGGASNINGRTFHALNEYTRLSDSIIAIVDGEREAEDHQPKANVLEFKSACDKLNITCHILEKRAIENYFQQEALDEVFGGSVKALSPFEKLNKVTPSWYKTDNWRLAQATPLEVCKTFDFWQTLDSIPN